MAKVSKIDIASIGSVVDHVYVSIGPQFLNLFSEHMYSSPNKAFEELVSNSWDAGAKVVYIGMPDDLYNEAAAIWVLDDGESMDIEGLMALWAVATSNKRQLESSSRPQIGKFGIGKLATYVLANRLTFVCRASDGIVRAVTMDYRRIDDNQEASGQLHMQQLPLDVRVLTDEELVDLMGGFPGGDHVMELIGQGVPRPSEGVEWLDEFGGHDPQASASSGTWTVALLTSLKNSGKDLQPGWVRWLLRTALPLGSSMSLVFNGEPIPPSKVNVGIAEEWMIGEQLGMESITLPSGESVAATSHSKPYPHITIDTIPGEITGRVRLYEDKISGGKSDVFEASNGFHVNVLGRVINVDKRDFGLDNLSHSAWAKFRATIRADGLDEQLSVNREGLQEGPELAAFRAFLMALFNKARSAHDAVTRSAWPSAGEVLTKSWSGVPLQPLLRVVSDGLSSATGLPDFIDDSGVTDRDKTRQEWDESATDPGQLIEKVEFEMLPADEPLVRYDLAARRVVVNRNHPFAREHMETQEEKLLLRDASLVEFLTQTSMLDIGIDEDQLREVSEYKDQALRLVAQVHRRTGVQIAELLISVTGDWKGLERILGDALDYLGFEVTPMGQTGKPEGLATAPTTPTEEDKRLSYTFTYDAKSSKTGPAKTGNVNPGTLARHRKDYKADHTLVVAPDYQAGALEKECKANVVTPMRAADLGALLMLAGSLGPIDLNYFRSIFQLHDPDSVHDWVKKAAAKLKSQRALTLGHLLQALEAIGYEGPNALNVAVIAERIGNLPDMSTPTRQDLRAVVRGLAVLVPSLIRITKDDVFLSQSPQKLRDAILTQISGIPAEYRFGIDELLNRKSAQAAAG